MDDYLVTLSLVFIKLNIVAVRSLV